MVANPEAKRSGYTLTLTLEESIGLGIFRANSQNYSAEIKKLQARDAEFAPLCLVLEDLFTAGVIVACEISYGRKLIFRLSEFDDKGHKFLSDGAINRFKETFRASVKEHAEIDLGLDVTYADHGTLKRPRRGSGASSFNPWKWLEAVLKALKADWD
ncbi:MAG TPA: hypothetical protein VD907_00095 [Verrucomicrobiae bacterium]|nr:hypothetical protein [Verrucomicrobiae bacterium]